MEKYMIGHGSAICGAALAVAILTGASATFAAKTYYADEGLTYNGNGCQNANLVSDISSMLSNMASDGFTGLYYTNGNAWPEDFRESCSSSYGNGGLDSTYADTKAVSIFSGHGSSASIQFSHQRNGNCTHNLGANGRLGSMAGASSAVGIYSTCDTLLVSSLANGANWNWQHENLGFHGLVDNGLAFYYASAYQMSDDYGNAEAWITAFDYPYYWNNAPAIAVAYAPNSADCWYHYDYASLKSNVYLTPRPNGPSCGSGQPAFIYCYSYNN